MRRQAVADGQRLDGAGERDAAIRRSLREGLLRTDAELHRQRLRCRNTRIHQWQNRFRRHGYPAEQRGSNTPRHGSGAARIPWNLPTVFGPVAISYNINAVDTLVFDAPTLAQDLQRHDHQVERSGDRQAQPVHAAGRHHGCTRSDESGTTRDVPGLSRGRRRRSVGKGTGRTFQGGVGKGRVGNEGTAATVKNTEGAITYNEWSFCQAQNLFTAKIGTADRWASGPNRSADHRRPGQRVGQ